MTDLNEDSYTIFYRKAEDSSGFLLWQSAMCWQRKINKVLAGYELTYTQFVVLMVADLLKQQTPKVYQHQVARSSRIDRMMTSRIMASLERKKLITRIKQSDDARTNLVMLTKKGKETLALSLPVSVSLENEFFISSSKIGPDLVRYMEELLPEC